MASYFSHDSNARNDTKILALRMQLGMEGYGIYFALIEMLRESKEYKATREYNVLGYDLHVDAIKVKQTVEDFGLFAFTEDGECFYSESLLNRMDQMETRKSKLSEAGKRGAARRWSNQEEAKKLSSDDTEKPELQATDSHPIATPMANDSNKKKRNKNKINKRKEEPRAQRAKRDYAPSSEEYKLAGKLWEKVKTINPEAKQPDLQSWSDDIRKMHEIDGRGYDRIARMIDWSQANDFWQSNILSAAKLRKQYDTMAAQANAEAKRPTVSPNRSGRQRRIEEIPEWLREDYVKPKIDDDPKLQAEIEQRLKDLAADTAKNKKEMEGKP